MLRRFRLLRSFRFFRRRRRNGVFFAPFFVRSLGARLTAEQVPLGPRGPNFGLTLQASARVVGNLSQQFNAFFVLLQEPCLFAKQNRQLQFAFERVGAQLQRFAKIRFGFLVIFAIFFKNCAFGTINVISFLLRNRFENALGALHRRVEKRRFAPPRIISRRRFARSSRIVRHNLGDERFPFRGRRPQFDRV